MADKSRVMKIRRCGSNKHCQFKNVWWDPKQCLAKFHVWHTCLYRGEEEKVKKVMKDGPNISLL